ncbi:MAG: hypothetical protein LUQ25_02080 [Methanoregulaceae archaeon]|nr:hypothetical protein [Methanoregulaceae archaeon]
MKWIWLVAVLALILTIPHAGAFTADTLDISVGQGGDSSITFRYNLNWIEYFVVYLKIADPADQIRDLLEQEFRRPVEVDSVTPESVSIRVHQFAAVRTTGEGTTYTTPPLSFAAAEEVLRRQWFAALVSPDFSPRITTVQFPDGYTQRFDNQISIPAVTHTVA